MQPREHAPCTLALFYFHRYNRPQPKALLPLGLRYDLFRGRFVTDDGDFSEFEWELEESHIYMD